MTTYQRVFQGIAAVLLLSGIAMADDVRELTWEDLIVDVPLIPKSGGAGLRPDEMLVHEPNAEVEGYSGVASWGDNAMGVVEALDGAMVKLPGFIVPLELDAGGSVKEFLLVPYFGACVHYPPPPPNQMVYVTPEKPVELELTWGAIWATGELKTGAQNSEYGAVGYSMKAASIETYEYE